MVNLVRPLPAAVVRPDSVPTTDEEVVVTSNSRDFLRLHVEESSEAQPPGLGDVDSLDRLLTAFQRATGWEIELDEARFYDASVESPQIEPDAIRLRSATDSDCTAMDLGQAEGVARAMVDLLGELQSTRVELWRREAELSVAIPVSSRPDEEEHLAIRLEAILKGGAQAVGCSAAALYLLDDATTQLKLRACWGLPKQRLVAPARPLRGAVADLEALLGNAVVLDDTSLLQHWKVPESCGAAVCVPVSSPTEPLGTLWYFAESAREFTDEQTNLVEIIAGRVSSELQREILLRQSLCAQRLDKQLLLASQWQNDHLPSIKPMVDGWDVAGRSRPAEVLDTGFFDWFVPTDGSLACALGRAEGSMFEAALMTSFLQASLRAHAEYDRTTSRLLRHVNESVWDSSAGGQFASLACFSLQPEQSTAELSIGGRIDVFLVHDGQVRKLQDSQSDLLGLEPDSHFTDLTVDLPRGGLLVAASSADKHAQTGWAELLREPLVGNAERVVDQILARAPIDDASGTTLLVLRRA